MIQVYHLKEDIIPVHDVVTVIRRAFRRYTENNIISIGARITEEGFRKEYENCDILLAWDQNIIIGVLALNTQYIEMIAVDPSYQKTGVGKALLTAAEDHVLVKGYRILRCDTSVKMKETIRWWRSNGFYKVACASYPSTNYFSIILLKQLQPDFILRLRGMLHYPLSWLRTRLVKKSGIKIDPAKELSLSDIQNESLRIMNQVHEFCVSHGILYSLGYGSLIGAVRHKGFIPWDDDIDIIMPREDYERFLKEFDVPGLGLFSNHQEGSYILYSRVYDLTNTFCTTRLPFANNYYGGIWIDIFPADKVEEDFAAFKKKVDQLTGLYHNQMWLRDPRATLSSMPTLKKKLGLISRKIMRRNGAGLEESNHQMELLMRELEHCPSNRWSQMACMDEGVRMWQLAEDFENTVLLPFEDSQFCVMNGYHRVLTNIYGDYMKLPPKEEQIPHQDYIHFYYIQ